MILTPEEAAFILKKLEYTFKKKSGHLVIEKLKTDVDIEIDDTEKDLIKRKFEYTFKKSDHPIRLMFN